MVQRLMASLAIAVSLGFAIPSIAQNTDNTPQQPSGVIKVIQFPGGTALPLYVAQDKGFFKKAGLQVELTPTFDSRQLMTQVLEGKYQIGQAAIDNVIAYDEKQAAPELDLPRDLVAFMGTSSTNLNLIVQPDIHSYADLKGKSLAVDAPNTGFAFVLREMLKKGGLQTADYKFLPVGGDVARLDALKKGQAAGALLTTVFANQAEADGLKLLGTSIGILHHYQGTSVFARKAWEGAHRTELIKFTSAVAKAHRWIFEPQHHKEAAEILVKNSKNLSLPVAEKTIANLTAAKGGLSHTGALDKQGIQTVLDLRNEYSGSTEKLGPVQKYIDDSYYEAAIKNGQHSDKH